MIFFVFQQTLPPQKDPISCEYCSKLFRYKSSYVEHVITHTGERPYACDHCDKRFSRASNLRKHLLTIHADYQANVKKQGY